MSKASTFFKSTAILSTALLSLLGACAIDDPIDYTTDGYTAGPQGGGSGDGGNTGSSDDFVEWTRQLGTSDTDYASGIATDSSGNVYVTGYTRGALEGNNAGVDDLFVVKYDSAGDRKWTKQLGTSSYDIAEGIATDSSGNIYLTGFTHDIIDGSYSGSQDLFVVKYDSAGDWKWTRQVDDNIGADIIADSNGDIYVAGSVSYSLDGNVHYGSHDLILMKYDSDGNKLWTKQPDGSLSANGLTMDDNGNIYITGSAHSEICNGLPGHDEDYEACLDAFVVKYDSEGDWKWTQQIGTSTYDTGYGITTDSSGNVYLTGVTSGNLDGNTNAGEYDLFVMKLK